MSIYKKLFEIQKMNLAVKKDWKNPHFKSDYITLDGLINVLQPICTDKNLLIAHKTENNCVITFIQDVENDEKIESAFPLPNENNPQKLGSAITYAKRYNLCQIFNIITDRDDDGNKASEKAPDKQYITSPIIDNLIKAIQEGQVVATSSEEAIEQAQKKYKVSDISKKEITQKFNSQVF